MEIIDAEWLRARLTRRGDKAALARAIGLKPKQISEILSGQRAVKQEEVGPILRFFGERAPEPSDVIERVAGFAESSAEPLRPKLGSPAENILRVAKITTAHPALYLATQDMPEAQICRRDLLIIDLKARPAVGDLVVCTIADPETGKGGTHVRRWFPPWLASGADAVSAEDETGSVAILGRVAGVIRGDFL